MMEKDAKIYVAGHRGMVGSAIVRELERQGYTNIITRTHSELEKTNEAYALAKISGLKYCEFLNRQYGTDYISVMPTNLYGPNDNYHPTHSHVLPALIRRFHEAKEQNLPYVTCWGDGSPLRYFQTERYSEKTSGRQQGGKTGLDIQDGTGRRDPPVL